MDWHVPKGALVALVGPSGIGKSTAIRLALGLTRPDQGHVEVAGTDPARLRGKDARRWRRSVQWMPQHPDAAFDPRMTIDASFREALAVHRLTGEVARRRITETLGSFRISPKLADRRPMALSGGEIQRFALARALLLEPKVLFLDEPTAMLDLSVQAEILHLVMDLRRNDGLTVVLVTHDLEVARRIADRVDRVRDGVILSGTISQNTPSPSLPSSSQTTEGNVPCPSPTMA
jgi:ABC-type glutathione transport system ATPase component